MLWNNKWEWEGIISGYIEMDKSRGACRLAMYVDLILECHWIVISLYDISLTDYIVFFGLRNVYKYILCHLVCRLAVGSFVEEYNNKVQIVQLDEDTSEFVVRSTFDHPYPTTKIMWIPDSVSITVLWGLHRIEEILQLMDMRLVWR